MKQLLKKLEDLLEKERKCLLNGEYEKLTAYNFQKSQILIKFEKSGTPTAALSKIADRLVKHQKLIEAAKAGLSQGKVQFPLKNLETYTSKGARNPLQSDGFKLEKRL